MIIVFNTKIIADELLKELAATPDGCFCFYDPDSTGWDEVIFNEETKTEEIIHHEPKNRLSYSHADDGRVAIEHHWDQENQEWLLEYFSEDKEVSFVDELPDGWITASEA